MASTADIRMNQATVASNGNYVYAEAADGSLVKISKASLASLIKGLLPVVSSTNSGLATAFTSLMYIGDITDCNTNNQGVYRVRQETTLNLPTGVGGASILISIRAYPDSSYMFQLLFGLNTYRMFFRRSVDKEWGQWKEFSFV